MNQETKLRILNVLHQLPLTAIRKQADRYKGTSDEAFWESLYQLEKKQRSC